MSMNTRRTALRRRPSSRQVTETYYAEHRAAALRRAEEILRPVMNPFPIDLGGITSDALEAFEAEWEGRPERRYEWPWREMVDDYSRNEPGRLALAIWSGDVLCGLAIGKLRARYCSVNYVEGSPLPAHPLKGRVLPVVLTVLTAYAKAVDRQQIRLVDPFDAMVPCYEAHDFVLATPKGEPRYCWKAVP